MKTIRLIGFTFLTLSSALLGERYPSPPGGWDYIYDGNEFINSPTDALDGTWVHNNGTVKFNDNDHSAVKENTFYNVEVESNLGDIF